ncbi:penicillin acylase family protein [Actinophytocola sp.]|uniref:penicillin acylase family protein n=1 Tax=Actinophytocola sp. TaxID=1872138 RepID=UPI002D3C0BA5|nr:penicillin acylase family protein [Actinophytocola sp.]HYQ65264.1 penicillin acylase family protein [Actinophytocola sp.]
MRLTDLAARLVARSGRARHTGHRRVAGIRSETTITRDDRGVPTIHASTEPDLYFAAGYAQAQDRRWQMDVLRRRAHGRLSEILGPATVAEDTRARRLALTRVARASERLLSDACRANLAAFSEGVNAATRGFALPPEFLLLRYRPEPWTPLDSIALVKRLGFDLGLNLKYELFRARLAAEHPEYNDLLGVPRYPADGPVTIRSPEGPAPTTAALPTESRAWLADLLAGEQSTGSNAWVLAGGRTASGFPLLANDPHVLFTHPSLWYQQGLRLPGARGYGVTVPGIPGLIAGANDDLAWGVTNSTVDTQDLCTLDGTPPLWRESTTITVRGADDVLTEAAGGDGYVHFDDGIGLFWSGCIPSAEIESCQRMWRTGSYVDFREALRSFGVPVLNVAVAGQDGTIALKTAGNVPHRVRGSGVAPGSYADVARSWQRFLDFVELPEVVDPAEGYIVSANHKLLPDNARIDVGQDWVAPYRAARIEELIVATPRVNPEDCARWQLDDLDGRARRLLPALLEELPEDSAAYELLANWDCHDRPEAHAPLVFMRLLQIAGDEWLGNAVGSDLAALVPDLTQLLDHLVLNPAARKGLNASADTFAEAAARITPTPYADIHRIVDPHPLARAASVFHRPPTRVGGSRHTVCLMAPNPEGEVIEGAPWRFVAEPRPDGSRMWDVLRHGSSGHPRSPHYDDQTPAHTSGELHPMTFAAPPGRHHLLLTPRTNGVFARPDRVKAIHRPG